MRHTKRQNLTARFQRFSVSTHEVSVIVKNARSRCACFWFGLSNISASGVGLEYIGFGHVPFSEGDVLNLTIDTGCSIFKRPIHLKAIIRRREETKQNDGSGSIRIFLGAEITAGDSLHENVWLDGLSTLGDPYKMEAIHGRQGRNEEQQQPSLPPKEAEILAEAAAA